VVLVVYTYLLYAFPLILLQITAWVAVALVLVIMGWIGWTMATTPPPAPLELEPPKADVAEEKTKATEN
jgi:predicted DNA-binding transcriptional regulator